MIKKFILCDQAPWLWSDPNETDESMILHGGHRGHPYEFKKDMIFLGKKVKKSSIQKIFSQLDLHLLLIVSQVVFVLWN